jgi:hypothetical protein
MHHRGMRGLLLVVTVSLIACATTPWESARRECEQQVAAEMGYQVNANGTWSPPAGEVEYGGPVYGSGAKITECLRDRGVEPSGAARRVPSGPPRLDGEYEGILHGATSGTFRLRAVQTGESVAGTWEGGMGRAGTFTATVDGLAFRGTLSSGGMNCPVTGTYGEDSAAGAFTCEGGAVTRFGLSRNSEPDVLVEERLPPVRRR